MSCGTFTTRLPSFDLERSSCLLDSLFAVQSSSLLSLNCHSGFPPVCTISKSVTSWFLYLEQELQLAELVLDSPTLSETVKITTAALGVAPGAVWLWYSEILSVCTIWPCQTQVRSLRCRSLPGKKCSENHEGRGVIVHEISIDSK